MNPRAARDDSGSLILTELLLVVVVLLSALLLPLVTGQLAATRSAEARERALTAAQAGVQATVALIRAAADAGGDGLLTDLPGCLVTGDTGADPGVRAAYRVTVTYRGAAGENVGCAPARTPVSAQLTAAGTVTRRTGGAVLARRVLDAAYTFRTAAQSVPGGPVWLVKPTSSSPELCLDAGTGTPAPGAPLRAASCAAGSAAQQFVYDRELKLVLASSMTTQRPLGMCVHADGAGRVALLQPCTTPARNAQKWVFGGKAMFESGGTPGQCLTVDTYAAGAAERLQPCNAGTNWSRQVVSPDAGLGAGAAGAATGQLVNFAQFGRCLDVTLSDVSYGYLIVWPCKQDLDPKNIDWNQRWELPAADPVTAQGTGAIVVRPKDDVAHCLRSPRSAAPGAYVTVTPCPAGPPSPELRWTVHRNTGAYDTSYRIRDASGLCLAPTDPDAPQPDLYPLHGYTITKSVVRPCDDGKAQKWNADPWVLGGRPVEYVGER